LAIKLPGEPALTGRTLPVLASRGIRDLESNGTFATFEELILCHD
jgi:hypothetical protein